MILYFLNVFTRYLVLNLQCLSDVSFETSCLQQFCTGMVLGHYYRILLLLPSQLCTTVSYVLLCLVYSITMGFSPTLYTVDPRLLPLGNPFKYQVEALSLQPIKQYIITHMFGGVLHNSCLIFVWCPCMAINVSVQYNGGLLSDIILLTQCYYYRGTRKNAMKRFCYCSL